MRTYRISQVKHGEVIHTFRPHTSQAEREEVVVIQQQHGLVRQQVIQGASK